MGCTQLNNRILADCYKKIATVYLTGGNYKEAITYYHNALSVNKSSWLNDSAYEYEAKLYLGSAYYQLNIIDSARYFFEEAATYANNKKDLPDLIFLYNSLGVIYYESANFLQAKNYFEQALPEYDNRKLEDTATYVSINTNIATCLKFLGRQQEALALYYKLLPFNIATEKISYNIASTYLLLRRYDSALVYYNRITGSEDITAIRKLNDIGRIFTQERKWQQAEKIFDSSISLNKKLLGAVKNKELANSYIYKASLAQKQGLTDEAIVWCNNALEVLHFDFKWKKITDLPADETKVISPLVFFEALKQKAELLSHKYKVNNDEQLLVSALDTYMKAIRLAAFIKASFDNDDARLFFKENYRDIYVNAIDAAHSLAEKNDKNALDNFLRIMESYKGSILYQNLLMVEVKNSQAIPAGVIKKEKELKQLLAVYTAKLNNTVVAEEVPGLQNSIIEVEVEISRLQKLYEQYPEFETYKRQSDANSLTTDAVREQLDSETAVISFIYAKEYIYGLAITDTKVMVRKIVADSLFEKNVQSFIRSLYEHTAGKRYEGYKSSAGIYQQLIKPFLPAASEKKRWVILPDGLLNYIPFNALQQNQSVRHYLAEDKIISNHYSLLLLLGKSEALKNSVAKPVIFAPFISENKKTASLNLPALFSSADEVNAFRGKSFTAGEATKEKFISEAQQASVIHLATHAIADIDSNANACIYFYPLDSSHLNNRLYAQEVYNLELHNTKLVILSACETAKGKNTSGEGLLSLTRAFLYAGSDGVISTFWKTDDKVCAYIMQQLHYHLKQGKGPEEALYHAKKDFLNNEHFDPHYKTPNYWANFIYIGNLTTAPKATNVLYYTGAVVMLACIFLYIFIQNKLQKNKRFRKINI